MLCLLFYSAVALAYITWLTPISEGRSLLKMLQIKLLLLSMRRQRGEGKLSFQDLLAELTIPAAVALRQALVQLARLDHARRDQAHHEWHADHDGLQPHHPASH